MERNFYKFLLFCGFIICGLQITNVVAALRIKRAYYGYLSPSDPFYHEKLEIQRQNLMRIDAAYADLRRNSRKYTFRHANSITSQINRLDLTRPDALDGISYFTKNNLYRYRVNKGAVKSVKERVKNIRVKCFNIYEGATDAFLKSRRKLLDVVGNAWRRSYIVPNEEFRPPITFS